MAMKILVWIFGLALTIGVGEALVKATIAMAGKAAQAHQHGMMPQSKWNRMLWQESSSNGHP